MYFRQIKIGGYDENFSYLIGDEATREVMVVDPDNLEMLSQIITEEGLKVKGILITHEHGDHVVGVPATVEKYGVPVYIHAAGRHKVENAGAEIKEIVGGELITIGGLEIRVIHTPGHAPGAVCFLAEGKLIVGDTLFVGGCGRCDLAGSDVEAMYVSLFEILAKFPDETEIYPGHDYGERPYSTIGREKKENRFLACKSKEEFVKERLG